LAWIAANREWVFSGIGVFAIAVLWALLGKRLLRTTDAQVVQSNRGSANVQAGRDVNISVGMLQAVRAVRSDTFGDHLLAIGEAERTQALKQGYSGDVLACYVTLSPGDGCVPLYRLWHERRFDHFYTTDTRERDSACRELGYIEEGVCCYVHKAHVPGSVPLYRLWQAEFGDHLYTTSLSEKDQAMSKLGYRDEANACYVFNSPASGRTPMYRLFRAG
jgi:hypothetical protein